MYPTIHNSLIAITELPTFVISIGDIQIAHFERVGVNLSIKNFDMVFVYKDYVTFKRINSIPVENLPVIKKWLDHCNIVMSEGPMPLNWQQVLQSIRDDFHNFVEEGGWGFLQEQNEIDDLQAKES